jgi:hypothetical protein
MFKRRLLFIMDVTLQLSLIEKPVFVVHGARPIM